MKEVKLRAITTPWKFFKEVSHQHRAWLYLSVLVISIAGMLSSGISYLFKLLVDAAEAGDVQGAMFYGLFFPVLVFIMEAVYRVSGLSVGYLTIKINKGATDIVLKYLMAHDHDYFSNRFAGSITNKIKNITGALDQIVPDILWGQLDALVRFSVTFALIWMVDFSAALVFLLLLISLAIVSRLMSTKKTALSKANAAAGTIFQGRAVDVVGNMGAVRQYVRENYELQELYNLTENKKRTSIATWMYTEKMLLANAFVIFLFSFVMFWILVTKWGEGMVTTGEFVLVVSLISQIAGMMLFVGRSFNTIARAVGELREGLDEIYLPHALTDVAVASELRIDKGEITLNNASFTFGDNPVFNNLSLTINGQQRVGLVGPSGAGKSTFVSLLLRQQDLGAGSIHIDGQNIALVTQATLREAISLVPQEPALFHRTIRENIAYGQPNATMENIERVARMAFAHDFIMSFSDGYETMVGERGVKLSGGQKQRVAIARAMLKGSPILILDEATSALDSESEMLIQKALATLMVGKTVIAIAHRLSTLREMDRIIVLEDGKIVEDGKPEDLRTSKGPYARLWSHQVDGFIAD